MKCFHGDMCECVFLYLLQVCGALSESARKNGVLETPDSMFAYLIERVRNNLHVVLCMSPVGEPFRYWRREGTNPSPYLLLPSTPLCSVHMLPLTHLLSFLLPSPLLLSIPHYKSPLLSSMHLLSSPPHLLSSSLLLPF